MGNTNPTPSIPIERHPTADSFAGLLIGECVADALGLIVEGSPADQCSEFVSTVVKSAWNGDSETLIQKSVVHKPLQYSDDGQMTREMVLSIVENGGTFSPAHYAQRLGTVAKESRFVGCGWAVAKSMCQINRGTPWHQSGCKPGQAGNGTAIRAGPIGLLYWNDPEQLIKSSIDQSIITHQDVRCKAGAVAIASSVAYLISHERLNPDFLLQKVSQTVRLINPEFASGILEISEWLSWSTSDVISAASKKGQDFDDGSNGIAGFVISSVLWSMYCFLKHPDNYLDCISEAISAGGDTDSTAAMAGCLSGAYLGLQGIQNDLLLVYFFCYQLIVQMIQDKGTFGFESLVSLSNEFSGQVLLNSGSIANDLNTLGQTITMDYLKNLTIEAIQSYKESETEIQKFDFAFLLSFDLYFIEHLATAYENGFVSKIVISPHKCDYMVPLPLQIVGDERFSGIVTTEKNQSTIIQEILGLLGVPDSDISIVECIHSLDTKGKTILLIQNSFEMTQSLKVMERRSETTIFPFSQTLNFHYTWNSETNALSETLCQSKAVDTQKLITYLSENRSQIEQWLPDSLVPVFESLQLKLVK